MINPDELVSIDDAADQTGISRRTLFRMIKAGEIRSFKRRGDRRTFVYNRELRDATEFTEHPPKA